jgi:hypothetical protein
MMGLDGMDDRYVTFREHVASSDEIKSDLRALELAHARLSASLMHVPDKLDQLSERIDRALAVQAPPPPRPSQELVTYSPSQAYEAWNRMRPSGTPGIVWAMLGGALAAALIFALGPSVLN